MNKKGLLIGLLLVASFIYLLLFQLKAIWPFTIDDMYISLRYAKHWADGYGLLWNIGEEPVEGYSNYSFVVLAAVSLYLHLDPVIVLKSAGVLGLFFATAGVYFLSRLWFSAWLAFIPCLWMLIYRGQIIWSVSGLETTVYQALLVFSLFSLLRGMGYDFYPQQRKKSNKVYFLLTGLLFALSAMTRPEAPALVLLLSFIALFDSGNEKNKTYYRNLLWSCSTFLILFLPYFIWRWYYYGRLFPNAVYCKGFNDFSAFNLDESYLGLILPFLLLALPAIFFAKDRRHYFLWTPSILYLTLLIGADPIVAFFNRLFLPVFILLLPLSLLGMTYILRYFLQKEDEIYYTSLVFCALLVAFVFIPSMSLSNYRYFAINPQAGEHLRQKVVDWLTNNVTQDSQVLLADSGMIPYLSPLRFIDSYCLNNKKMTKISHQERYHRMCQDAFLIKPEAIILTSLMASGRVIYTPTDYCLRRELKKNKLYQFRTIYQVKDLDSSYRYEIYTLLN
ncbi:protein LphB [Legionella donaldsonii]|uniref:protein LphB n=1 Tax=Legionella donaldsonii TaxID=45060 RepID=UPI00399C96FF